MTRINAPEATLRYQTTERWRWPAEMKALRTLAPLATWAHTHDDVNTPNLHDTTAANAEPFAPVHRPQRQASLLHGILKEVADLHRLEDRERAGELTKRRGSGLGSKPDLDRLQIEQLVAQARMCRAAGSAWRQTAAMLTASVRRVLRLNRSTAAASKA